MSLIQTSKFLSYVLRHRPDSIGIALDDNGWVAVEELLSRATATGTNLDFDKLKTVVDNDDKKRFTFNEDMTRIRAAQGHSVEVDIAVKPVAPPDVLYHGTAVRSLDAILAEGLKPMRRRHVHLSADVETATRVGQRHGKPAVLRVDAAALARIGQMFWQADNGVWLSEPIAPGCLRLISDQSPAQTEA